MVKKYYSNELYHHGVKGMHWGIRRYQREDGSYIHGNKGRSGNQQKKIDKKGLSDGQKKALKIAGGVAAAAALAGIGYVAYKNVPKIISKNKGRRIVENTLDGISTFKPNEFKPSGSAYRKSYAEMTSREKDTITQRVADSIPTAYRRSRKGDAADLLKFMNEIADTLPDPTSKEYLRRR